MTELEIPPNSPLAPYAGGRLKLVEAVAIIEAARQREYRERNKEKRAARQREYYERNKEKPSGVRA